MKFACEVINDNGKYYANMTIGGYTVEGLPKYVSYNELRNTIKKRTGILMPKRNDMIFEKLGSKYHAIITNL